MFAQRKIDPELEKLRNEVDGPPNLDTVTLNIQRESSRIHAAYLFEHIGKATLQKLCLLLSSTATGKIYNGWQEFAAHMGLTMEQIRCIDYDFKGLQDPTYYVLLTYVQSPDATMDKILSALQKIERFDVISEIKDYMHNLASALSQDAADELEIIQPTHIPRAPLVLSPILTEQCKIGAARESESRSIPQDDQQKHTKQKYSCIVMLTFAGDGLAIVECITKIFRSKQPPIGVLILQEQKKGVYSRAEEFIDDCFKQVDYIIPILTKGYIEMVNNPAKASEKIHNHLDTKYLKYIYSLLRYEYVANECCNNRVRCIVPDKDVYIVVRASLHPTLQAWFRESDIDDFVNNILLHKF
ncbi:PREDICTED: uncharacterized protein LOC106746147 [Dinoponera quadriceps]|uniref:Uncharacterized protein LOC106746147 n=1 Tax=Dinoponera quadriceps TaxID=609295 RepID=A0A6P3XHD6_DINQU|nr:PREDICTED: uncharacterized protein LOC106746147 [Dinoponera quadriceps]XP_014477877.1 PREDICTED: uncharacterized protein LOC106746147 [Dinoponera quadriceps]